MTFITSRRFVLPASPKEMANFAWFNMWKRKNWPYRDLMVGDTLYWYESKSKRLRWKTQVVRIKRFRYSSKKGAVQRIKSTLGDPGAPGNYYANAPSRGICLAYRVSSIQRLDSLRPRSIRVPQLGWSRPGESFFEHFFGNEVGNHNETLDDIVPGRDPINTLRKMDQKMANVSPKRIEALVNQTIRRDTKLIKALKKLCGFRCQFPRCGIQTPKRGGGYYIEVAHIKAVAKGGRSRLGNLLVLCPNHHKEFDWGDRRIVTQTWRHVSGMLNGKRFDIWLPTGGLRRS